MATYVNDLRLKEIATGDSSGTWGSETNTNLELIAEALSFGTQDCFSSDANATTTVADGSTDPARSIYFKVTSSATLSTTRELTIGPNTISRLMFIENATTGSQIITIKQGSGATVNIGNGAVKAVYLDGAGSGAAVADALVDLDLTGTTTAATLTASGVITGATLEATGDTSAGDNAAIGFTSTEGIIITGQGSTNDVTIKNDADADVLEIPTGTTEVNITNALKIIGTTPSITIGDAGAEDTKIVFDGNAQDFYIGLDDSEDDLVIGKGSTVGTTPIVSMTDGGAVTLKGTATGDDSPMVLTLQTAETDIAADDVLGKIDFQAPDEAAGTDAILVAAGIEAVSEGDFSATSNATKLSFKTGASEAAAEKMALSSAGVLTVNSTLQLKNGATSAGKIEFFEDSDNGTNKVTLIGPASTADITLTLPNSDGDDGQVLTTDGNGALSFTTVGGAYNTWLVKTGNYTALVGDQIVVNSASATTITLPASASAGNTVIVKATGGGVVTIGRNSQNINSTAADGTLLSGASTQLVFVDSTIGFLEI